MGLSSSQARLLSLTSRMHDIEYKAQHLEAQKLQMANESAHVYKEYDDALNKTKIQVKQLASDGSTTYIDATYNSMKSLGYTMKFQDDYKPIISAATESNFKVAGNNRDYFIALESGRVTTTNTKVNGVTEIYTADQLKNMSSSGNYRLMSDIDMTGINWTSKSFSGNLDGNGHTIRGLNKALFSTMSGTVSNLNINGDVTSQGILAITINSGTVENVTVSGSVNSTGWGAGGIAGLVRGTSNVTNCSSSANVKTTAGYGGSLIGYIEGSTTVDNCSSSGNVEGLCLSGGLVGSLNSSTGSITNCKATGNVYVTQNTTNKHGADSSAGGFIGSVEEGKVSNCEAYGTVTSESNTIGGFIGNASYNSTIENCNAYGNVIANVNGNMLLNSEANAKINAGGFASAVNGGTITNCNAYGTTSSGIPTQTTTSFASSDMDKNTGKIINCWAQDTTKPFVKNETSFAECNQPAPAPNNNVITVTPPTVKTTETVNDTTGAGKTFDEINKYGGYIIEGTADDPVGRYGDDSNWFTTMVNEGLLFLFKNDNEGNEYQVNVATDTSLQEVTNDVDLKKAEAKYEADMRKINAKDKKFDTDIASLESERNAISTEMDTLKSVAKDNIDRTFKLFS